MSTRGTTAPTSLRTRTTCRICGCEHLAPVLSLGDHRIAGAFADPQGGQPVQRAIPLELVRCDMTKDQDACGLIQTRHTVPGSILYSSYWYRSGVNHTMTENLHGIARRWKISSSSSPGTWSSTSAATTAPCSTVIEPRASDTSASTHPMSSRYAVEKGYDVVRDFFSAAGLRQLRPDQKAKAITSIAMFYDLEQPGVFVADVAEALAEHGIWVMELHYLPTMLEKNAFDAICMSTLSTTRWRSSSG